MDTYEITVWPAKFEWNLSNATLECWSEDGKKKLKLGIALESQAFHFIREATLTGPVIITMKKHMYYYDLGVEARFKEE